MTNLSAAHNHIMSSLPKYYPAAEAQHNNTISDFDSTKSAVKRERRRLTGDRQIWPNFLPPRGVMEPNSLAKFGAKSRTILADTRPYSVGTTPRRIFI
ncbi:MAG: hypothetical protein GY874_18170 [Desulfobacteraceae bacterium]|nr:hypothetical protein [Desulfobacteraceae bacterium]